MSEKELLIKATELGAEFGIRYLKHAGVAAYFDPFPGSKGRGTFTGNSKEEALAKLLSAVKEHTRKEDGGWQLRPPSLAATEARLRAERELK